MRMRITTGMAMNTYRYNLQNSTSNLTSSRNKLLNHRKFESFAEDPSSAVQAWRVRRAMVNNACYAKNNTDTLTRFDIAYTTMGTVSGEVTDKAGRASDLYAATDTTASGRAPLGQVLKETAETIINLMNGAKSGENFVFAGDDELNAPFSWDASHTVLYYRGVDVNAGHVKSPADPPSWGPVDSTDPEQPADRTDTAALSKAFLAHTVPEKTKEPGDEKEQEWINYYRNGNPAAAKPTSGIPDWAPRKADGTVVYLDDADAEKEFARNFIEQLPDKDSTAYGQATTAEQAWINYYKDDPAGSPKPSDEPAVTGPMDDFGVPLDAAQTLKDSTSTAYERAWAEYRIDQGDVKHLKMMSEEEATIDLGMGLMEDENGKLVPGTYFDRSLPGIEMLGYGVDENGDPNNVCLVLKRLGEIYSSCDRDTGEYASTEDVDEAMRLLDKLKAAQGYVSGQYVDISAQASYLKQNEERLDLQGSYLNEQRATLEDVDLADAITNFSWDYYCYSAALKVGTQLLSQSLIDYMN